MLCIHRARIPACGYPGSVGVAWIYASAVIVPLGGSKKGTSLVPVPFLIFPSSGCAWPKPPDYVPLGINLGDVRPATISSKSTCSELPEFVEMSAGHPPVLSE